MSPDWTVTNLIIQALAEILGANGAAAASHEHRFGFAGHTLVGLVAGALSGYFLQKIANTTVFGSGGEAMPTSAVETAMVQGLMGAVVGGIAMMVIGLIRREMTRTDL